MSENLDLVKELFPRKTTRVQNRLAKILDVCDDIPRGSGFKIREFTKRLGEDLDTVRADLETLVECNEIDWETDYFDQHHDNIYFRSR